MYDGVLQDLIDELGQLPGIGPKSAQRIAFHLVNRPADDVKRLADALLAMKETIRFCSVCGNISEHETCSICADERRERSMLCVVEEAKDIHAIERTHSYRGLYHVLGGAIDPINGIGPEQLRIRELLQRLTDDSITEVIIATNPTIEGEATTVYLSRTLGAAGIEVSQLASGLPVGSDLEYADEVTLGRAFEGRRLIN